jgi:hypothetical protein
MLAYMDEENNLDSRHRENTGIASGWERFIVIIDYE